MEIKNIQPNFYSNLNKSTKEENKWDDIRNHEERSIKKKQEFEEKDDLYNLDIQIELTPKEIEPKFDTATQTRAQCATGTPCGITFSNCCTRPDINCGTMCSKC